MRTILRRLLAALVIAAIGAALVWALWPEPVAVDLATATRGPLVVTVSDEGEARIREVYTVSAPVGGKVTRSPREEGDTVRAGETVVARIEPSEPAFLDIRTLGELSAAVAAAEAAVTLADAELSQAEARLTFAVNDQKRAASLVERKTIAPREFEERSLEVTDAEAAVSTARAAAEMRRRELDSARARLIQPGVAALPPREDERCCVTVRAPTDGVVIEVPVESEQVVAAGTPLIRLGDPADLEVVVDLLSHDAVRVTPGARAFIDGWGGPRIPARVRRIAPAARTEISALGIEEQRVEVILDLEAEPGETRRLGHNYRVIASVVVWEADDALTVPLGALFRENGGWATFVVAQDGTARLRPVTIGERSDAKVQILDGLKESERVVVHPSDRVTDGVRVTQREIVDAR